MESNKRQGPPFAVEIPKGKSDQPSWLGIGGIAIVCFAVGVTWPKVMGVRIGPNAPAEATAAAASRAQAAEAASAASSASAGAPAAGAPGAAGAATPAAALNAQAPAAAAPGPEVLVKNGVLLACRTDSGESIKGLGCGPIAFDGIAQPRIKHLSQCAAAQGAEGKLGVIFNLDFRSNRTTFSIGRSSNVKDSEGLIACLKQSFESVSLSAIAHEHPTYALLYNAHFSPPRIPAGRTASAAAPSINAPPASTAPGTPARPASSVGAPDSAQIVWEVAIVRDRPRTGQVVARLPRGSAVRVGPGQDGWFQVKYGDSFGSEGWLYRAAIGK
ncbi:hypothetical protein [Pendulispora albinea]|uniref:SH3 domain-containing protein n=1 Tax=Pendulispora albinea TaxID=2741071 RepID=A0ABZ2M0U0_9BACT